MYGRSALDLRILLCVITALAIGGTVGAGMASANPVPESALLIHVQGWDPEFCQNDPMLLCAEIVQYSEIEGDVEFDLFLANPFGFLSPFSTVSMAVQWPENWQFTSFEDCRGADVTMTSGDHSVSLQIEYESPVSPGTTTFLGRFRMQVTGFGALHLDDFLIDGEFYGVVGQGQAGVECSFSYFTCTSFMPPCGGYLDPDLCELTVPQGGTVTGTMSARAGWLCTPGQIEFMETASWLELGVVWDDYYYEAELTVNVNAAGLAPGDYTAVVRAVTQIVDCATVLVHVEPVSSVPDLDPDPATRARSWGEIKQTFR